MLQSMGSQRVRHNLATEQQQQKLNPKKGKIKVEFNKLRHKIISQCFQQNVLRYNIVISVSKEDGNKVVQEQFLYVIEIQFSSVTELCPTLQLHGLQHARLPCPSPTPMAYSNSCPLSW